jgi:predicted nucleotidyltransferase
VRNVDELVFGSETVDLNAVEQIVEIGQLRAIGMAIAYIQNTNWNGTQSIAQQIDTLMATITSQGLDALTEYPSGELCVFRRFELAAVINRLRSLQIK